MAGLTVGFSVHISFVMVLAGVFLVTVAVGSMIMSVSYVLMNLLQTRRNKNTDPGAPAGPPSQLSLFSCLKLLFSKDAVNLNEVGLPQGRPCEGATLTYTCLPFPIEPTLNRNDH